MLANVITIPAKATLGSFFFGLIGNFLPPLSEETKNASAETMDKALLNNGRYAAKTFSEKLYKLLAFSNENTQPRK